MKTLAELAEIREKLQKEIALRKEAGEISVLVGMATCGIAAGATPVMAEFAEVCEKKGIKNVKVSQAGCIGMCKYEPIVEIFVPGKEKVTYVEMSPEKVEKIVEEHIVGGNIVEEYTVGAAQAEEITGKPFKKIPAIENLATSLNDTEFYKKQMRVALRNCGVIDPEDINEYIAADGYEALGRVLTQMTPQEVVDTIKASGLKGRGGAGFPTGTKWQFAMGPAPVKYVCCNADEGDPGAFMDRSVLEGDPHVVLEAMTIAGYAIGAHQGYIYVRAEYPIAIHRLEIAIEQAKKNGFLGKNIFGSGFDFDIELRFGAGAFVCGEETALMTSIEGHRGEPRPRPPFPAVKGLFGVPTILNNVETWANIPRIILNGADWYSSYGTENSKGTKVFCLVGKINNTGLVEVPMGTTIRQVVEEIGGGIPNGKKFKAVQTGGPSGGCIPAQHFDTPIDYDNLKAVGSMMGSGGMIVMDEDTCMVDIAKFYLEFTVDESCGKCTACRIGTKRLLELLEKVTNGEGTLETLDEMEELAQDIQMNSLCALGQTAPNPVVSTMKYFRDEYEAHVVEKRCPAGVCKSLLSFEVDPEKCIGCTACTRICPVFAITGDVKKPHTIDKSICTRCGACAQKCRFGAITKR